MSFNLLDKGGITFLVTALWERVKAIVPTSAKDIGALPNTGGTIKGKLSVDVDADGANPELRVAQNRVDILKKDTVTDESGTVTETNYPLATYEGDWNIGKIRFRGRQFLISSIEAVVEGKLNLHKSKGIYGKTNFHSNNFRIDQRDDENYGSGEDNGLMFEIAGYHINIGHLNGSNINVGIEINANNETTSINGNRIAVGQYQNRFLDAAINSLGDWYAKLRGQKGTNMEIGLGISMNIPDGADFIIFNQNLDKVFKVQGDTNVVSVIEALSAHGNGNLGKYERAIELYNIANPDNPVRFYSNKGWEFGSGDADDFIPVFAISPNGQINIESVEIGNDEEVPITGSMARGKIAFKNSDPPAFYPSYNLILDNICMNGLEHIKVLTFEAQEGGQPDIYMSSINGDIELYIDYLILSSNVNNASVTFNGHNGKVYIGKKIGEFKVYGAPGVTVYGG